MVVAAAAGVPGAGPAVGADLVEVDPAEAGIEQDRPVVVRIDRGAAAGGIGSGVLVLLAAAAPGREPDAADDVLDGLLDQAGVAVEVRSVDDVASVFRRGRRPVLDLSGRDRVEVAALAAAAAMAGATAVRTTETAVARQATEIVARLRSARA